MQCINTEENNNTDFKPLNLTEWLLFSLGYNEQ